jgi:hypothetical protein
VSNKVVILQSNYIPWKGYFDLIHDADTFVFYDEVQYTKNDWRNRNKIYTSNGIQWLTIPIAADAVKLKISEVQITDKAWQDKHFKSIYYGYKKAPFFAQIEPWIVSTFQDRKWENLSQFNQTVIKEISALIGLKTTFINSDQVPHDGDRINKLVNILTHLSATEYISGPSARSYINGAESLFEDKGIKFTYKEYSGYPEYKQIKEPFEHSVSILDLLVNIPLEKIAQYIWK